MYFNVRNLTGELRKLWESSSRMRGQLLGVEYIQIS